MFSFSVSIIARYTSGIVWLIACLEIWKRFCRLVYESPVDKIRNVTASISWTGTDARNLVSIFTIFGPFKWISSSKSAGAIRVKFLYCPLTSWNFKSVKKLVPLHTDLFLYNSVSHQSLSCRFLLLDNKRCTNKMAGLTTCKDDIFPPETEKTGGSQRAAHSPECAPSRPNLNVGASKTPRDHVTLLRCGRMLKCVRGLTLPYVNSSLLTGMRWTAPSQLKMPYVNVK